MNGILMTLIRSGLVYLLMLVLTRIMGRKLISEMTFFDFVVGITIGATASTLASGPKANAAISTTVLVTFALLGVATGYLSLKSRRFRKLVNSEPVTMIANGRIIEPNLRKTRVTLTELLRLLREKDIFNLSDVEFALMEPNGKLSVLPKSQKQPVTPSDLHLETVYHGLTKDLILDGRIMRENLKDAHLEEGWLMEQLNRQGIATVEEVFYAGLDSSGGLYISRKGAIKETTGKYGIE